MSDIKNDKGRNYVATNWEYAQKHAWRLATDTNDPAVSEIVRTALIEAQREIDHWKRAYMECVKEED